VNGPRTFRWSRVWIVGAIVLSLAAIATFAARSVLKGGLDKVRTQIRTYVSQRSAFDLELGGARIIWLDRIEFRSLSLRHRTLPFHVSADGITIAYDWWGLLFRREKMAESLAEVRINGLKVSEDLANSPDLAAEFTKLFKTEKPSAGNPSFRIVLDDGELSLFSGRTKLKLDSVSAVILPGKDVPWKGRARAALSLSIAGKERFSGRWAAELVYDRARDSLVIRNGVKRVVVNSSALDDAEFTLQRTNAAWLLKDLRMTDRLSASAEWKNSRLTACSAAFDNFDMTPFLSSGSWKLNGRIRKAEGRGLDTKIRLASAEESLNLEIASGRLREFQLRQKQTPRAAVVGNIRGSWQGWIRDLDVLGKKMNAEFECLPSPSGTVVTVKRVAWGKAVFWQNYTLSLFESAGSFSAASRDGTLQAGLSIRNPAKSWFRFDTAGLPFDKVFGPGISASGLIDLKYPSAALKNASFSLGRRLSFTNIACRYDFRTNGIVFSARYKSAAAVISGRITGREGAVLFNGGLSLADGSHPVAARISGDRSSRHFDASVDGRIRLFGRLDRSSDFQVRMAVARQTGRKGPFWFGGGELSGNLKNKASWQGSGSMRLERLSGAGFTVPSADLSWQMENNQTVEMTLAVAGRGKRHMVTGFAYWGPSPAWQLSFNGLHADSQEEKGRRTLKVSCKEFDLAFLNDLADDRFRDRIAGFLDLQVSVSGQSGAGTAYCSVTNLRFAGLNVRRALLNGRLAQGQFELQPSRITLPDGEIKLVGLAAVSNFKQIGSVSADFRLKPGRNNYNGAVSLTAQNSRDFLNLKLSLFNARINNIPVRRYTQFVQWDRSKAVLNFFTEETGLKGSLSLARFPDRKAHLLDLGLFADSVKIAGLKGGISRQGVLDLRTESLALPMKDLVFLIPTCLSAEGVLEGELRIKGPRTAPLVYGGVELKDGRMKLAESLGELRGINLSVKMEAASVSIERCAFTVDGRPLTITGGVEIASAALSDYDLRLSMSTNDWIYMKHYNDIQGWISARMRISKAEDGPLIEGIVALRNMDFTYPFLSPKSAKRSPLSLDLTLVAQNNVSYFQNVNNILIPLDPGSRLQIQGLFNKGGRGDRRLTGNVTSSRGKIDYLGTTFKIDRVKLVFAEEYDPVSPYLEVAAETTLESSSRTYRAYLEGRGVLFKDFSINPYTVPSLTKQEIVSLLGYGRLYEKVLVDSGQGASEVDIANPTESEANTVLLAGVLTYFQEASQNALIKPLTRRIRKILNVDKLEVTTSLDDNLLRRGFVQGKQGQSFNPFLDTFNSTQFVIGKYFTDFLFVEYMLYSRKNELWKQGMPGFDNFNQLRLELDLNGVSFEWRYRPYLFNKANPSGRDEMEGEIKWQKTF